MPSKVEKQENEDVEVDISDSEEKKITEIVGFYVYPNGKIRYGVKLEGQSKTFWCTRECLESTQIFKDFEKRPRKGRGERNSDFYCNNSQSCKTQKRSRINTSSPKNIGNKRKCDDGDGDVNPSKIQKVYGYGSVVQNKVGKKTQPDEKNTAVDISKTQKVCGIGETCRDNVRNKKQHDNQDKDVRSSKIQKLSSPGESVQNKEENKKNNKNNYSSKTQKSPTFDNSTPNNFEFEDVNNKNDNGNCSSKTGGKFNLDKPELEKSMVSDTISTKLTANEIGGKKAENEDSEKDHSSNSERTFSFGESTLNKVGDKEVDNGRFENEFPSKTNEISTPSQLTINKKDGKNMDEGNVINNHLFESEEKPTSAKLTVNEFGNKKVEDGNIVVNQLSENEEILTLDTLTLNKVNNKNKGSGNITNNHFSKIDKIMLNELNGKKDDESAVNDNSFNTEEMSIFGGSTLDGDKNIHHDNIISVDFPVNQKILLHDESTLNEIKDGKIDNKIIEINPSSNTHHPVTFKTTLDKEEDDGSEDVSIEKAYEDILSFEFTDISIL